MITINLSSITKVLARLGEWLNSAIPRRVWPKPDVAHDDGPFII